MSPSQQDGARQLALVTGASSGIGLELARLFAQNNYDLVIAADEPAIEQAASELRSLGASVEAIQVDLATREGAERLAGRFGSDRNAPDAIALNAGVGLGGGFLDQDLEEIFHVINTNVYGTVHLAYRLLPGMVARGSGRVLFTSSIAARMPGSFQAIYNATKSFVQSFSEAIRNELKDTGVTITALQPGPTDTKFFERAGMEDTKFATGRERRSRRCRAGRLRGHACRQGSRHRELVQDESTGGHGADHARADEGGTASEAGGAGYGHDLICAHIVRQRGRARKHISPAP